MYIRKIGCDETGVGDYFSPLVACAVFIPQEKRVFLETLNIKDSKKINDKLILELAPLIKENTIYALNFFSQEKYNQIINLLNANELKMLLHLKNINEIENKIETDEVIIDQFSTEKSIYKYIDKLIKKSNKLKPIKSKLILETKAEDKFLEVAAASIIAREFLLNKMQEQKEKWNFLFPLGASTQVVLAGKEFIDLYGLESLKLVSKYHFSITDKIKNI